jgi:putative transposase
VLRMAKENPGWGYDRTVGALANPGLRLSDQTVGNILRRHDIPPAPKRKRTTSWKYFIRAHTAVLVATDFFTVEVLTLTGWITHYVLFFIHLESRRICLAGVTRHPDQEWMEQMARNVTMEDSAFLINRRYLLHDRDSKYCSSFGQVIEAGRVKTLVLPPRSPNLNAYGGTIVDAAKIAHLCSQGTHGAKPRRKQESAKGTALTEDFERLRAAHRNVNLSRPPYASPRSYPPA